MLSPLCNSGSLIQKTWFCFSFSGLGSVIWHLSFPESQSQCTLLSTKTLKWRDPTADCKFYLYKIKPSLTGSFLVSRLFTDIGSNYSITLQLWLLFFFQKACVMLIKEYNTLKICIFFYEKYFGTFITFKCRGS